MASRAYEQYGIPIPPEDPEQDVMTVQETAYVMKCSVSWLRRFLKANRNLHGYSGRRIVTNRVDRAAIYEAMRAEPSRPGRRTAARRRTPALATP
ncbi:DNA-binding protein [Streptomyces sp. NPDC057757]|uniref:DNA-binding protein n=1 Tax=Streptomyces sp. NPDC057757 TaxID=3346241 RepID=UPI0036D08F7B